MDPKWFAGRLRELREQAGLTQKQLGTKAGLSERAIAQWERGVREPGWSNILALCQALDVECTTFTQQPASRPSPGAGRPRKATAEDAQAEAETPQLQPPDPSDKTAADRLGLKGQQREAFIRGRREFRSGQL